MLAPGTSSTPPVMTRPGSPQACTSPAEINFENLTAHLMVNKKDYATQRGLRMLLGQRSRLSKYLKKDDPASYEKTMAALGLKMK